MSAPQTVTQKTFATEVAQSDIPVVVDFWAQWCRPCLALAPTLDEIAEELDGELKLAKVDVDQERTLAAMFQVMSIPTLMIFKDGVAVDTIQGALPKDELLARIKRQL